MTLYEIDSQMQGILDAIEAEGGEITPEQEYALQWLGLSRAEKLTNWWKYLRNLEAYEVSIDREIEYLKARKQKVRGWQDRAERHIKLWLPAGRGNWSDGVHSLNWLRSERAEPCMPVEQMREMFIRVKETHEFNKDFAKRYIKENGEVAEAKIVEHWSLQVK